MKQRLQDNPGKHSHQLTKTAILGNAEVIGRTLNSPYLV